MGETDRGLSVILMKYMGLDDREVGVEKVC